MQTVEINFMNTILEVEGRYCPEEPRVMYYNDMSGYPGSAPEFEIFKIRIADYDITELLEDKIEEIEREILKQWS